MLSETRYFQWWQSFSFRHWTIFMRYFDENRTIFYLFRTKFLLNEAKVLPWCFSTEQAFSVSHLWQRICWRRNRKKTFLILVKPKLSQLKDDIDKSVHVQFKFDWSISVQKQLCKSLIDSLQLPNFIDRKRVREREWKKRHDRRCADKNGTLPLKERYFSSPKSIIALFILMK